MISNPHTFRVCTALQARMADKAAIETLGIPSLVLMENAARAASEIIFDLHPESVQILCGPGNNGADGLAIGRILADGGISVQIYIDEAKLSHDEAVQLEIVKKLALPLYPLSDFGCDFQSGKVTEKTPKKTSSALSNTCFSSSDFSFAAGKSASELAGKSAGKTAGQPLIVDALFGNGLSRLLDEPYLSLIDKVNASSLPVVAIDLPSGIHSDSGKAMPKAIHADYTVALDCLKWGHLLGEGRPCSGQTVVKEIGIPSYLHEADGSVPLLDETIAASFLPLRNEFGNKGSFGKVLLCAGSFEMQGALSMAAKACFHCGCGTLTLFTPAPAAKAIAAKMDLAMILPAKADPSGFFAPDAKDQLAGVLSRYSQIGCGNGMGKSEGAKAVLETVLKADIPCVIDADGINLLGANESLLELLNQRQAPVILTPHVMEFSRLCHKPLREVLENPLALGREFIRAHPGVVLVLKSDWSLILSKDQELVFNHPNDALAKGGSGDVLCGIITGLASMKMAPFQAAALGVYLHNHAASYARSAFTFTPLDLIAHLPDVFEQLEQVRTSIKSKQA